MDRVAAPWRSASAQVLVEDLSHPELDGEAAHHLSRVLRLRDGAEVCATDGAGGWRSCRFDGRSALEPIGESRSEAPPPYPIAVGVALVKAGKPELVVQKLTELGVDRVVLFAARRSVVRWDEERSAKQLDRLRRVAVEACAQSRRLWLPTVEFSSLGELLAEGAVLADAGGRALRSTDRTVLVGPEGGWDPEDLGDAAGGGGAAGGTVDRVGLADHVLRAETAAITAGVLLGALRGGAVAPR